MPEDWPILKDITNNYNYFHHFVGATLHETLHELEVAGLVKHGIFTLPFHLPALLASLAVALGGLILGWWVYGRKPLEAGQEDPLVRVLTPPPSQLLAQQMVLG